MKATSLILLGGHQPIGDRNGEKGHLPAEFLYTAQVLSI